MVSPKVEAFGRGIEEQVAAVAPKVEEELRKLIVYLNDEVVPQVRRNSSEALRTASEQLGKLAEHIDRSSGPKKN